MSTTTLRHPSTCGKALCYCGKPATKHIAYGSGCGNVCDTHAARITMAKGGKGAVTITEARVV